MSSKRLGVPLQLLGRPLAHQVAAQGSGPGADVHHLVGLAHGLFVVLHHQHRVPLVAQAPQRGEKPPVVARMEPDGRLVQHVEHALEPCPYLGRQADALGLAAREGGRRAVEREVAQSHRRKEGEAGADLAQDLAADARLQRVEFHRLEEGVQLLKRERRELVDALAAELDGPRHGPQAGAVAVRAGAQRHELHQQVDVPLLVELVQHRDRAADSLGRDSGAQHRLAPGGRDVLPGGGEREAVGLSDGLQLARPPVREHQGALVGDGPQRPLLQRLFGIGNEQLVLEAVQRSQAFAGRAHAVGVVEGEAARLQLGQLDVAVGAGAHGRVLAVFAASLKGLGAGQDGHHALGHGKRPLDPLAQARQALLFQTDSVHHRFQGVDLVASELGSGLLQVAELPVDAALAETLVAPLLLLGAVLALAAAHHRG